MDMDISRDVRLIENCWYEYVCAISYQWQTLVFVDNFIAHFLESVDERILKEEIVDILRS